MRYPWSPEPRAILATRIIAVLNERGLDVHRAARMTGFKAAVFSCVVFMWLPQMASFAHARELSTVLSKSFDRRRHRPIQANVRSTT